MLRMGFSSSFDAARFVEKFCDSFCMFSATHSKISDYSLEKSMTEIYEAFISLYLMIILEAFKSDLQ